jgi:hypothetical protein
MNGELAETQQERKGLKIIVTSGLAIDGHGFPFVQKTFTARSRTRHGF